MSQDEYPGGSQGSQYRLRRGVHIQLLRDVSEFRGQRLQVVSVAEPFLVGFRCRRVRRASQGRGSG